MEKGGGVCLPDFVTQEIKEWISELLGHVWLYLMEVWAPLLENEIGDWLKQVSGIGVREGGGSVLLNYWKVKSGIVLTL
jgi:hypothetical protein